MRARLADIEAQLADAGRVDVLGRLVTADDVTAAWNALSLERHRGVAATLMEVRLHAVDHRTRTFRSETVGMLWKADT